MTRLVRTAVQSLMAASLILPITAVAHAQEGESAERIKLYEELGRESTTLAHQSNVLKTVARLVRPTVVHIEADKVERGNALSRDSHVEEAGSGYIADIGGRPYVLTNRHVIKNAANDAINIRLADGRVLHPTRVWSDPATDIAVMEVEAKNLVPVRFGDSNRIEIGDFVLAVGSPFGLSHSITFGIISATGRRDLILSEDVKFQDFLQTDAAINPGNSGGPLINLRGEVIGMNTAIASSSGHNEGIGFSIPVNMVKFVATQLVENNNVARAHLGVQLDHKFDPGLGISVGLKRSVGAKVSKIVPGSAAERAQIQVGDVILEFAGIPVDDDDHLVNLVGMTEANREVPVTVLRGAQPVQLKVKLGTAEDSDRLVPKK
jgi:serine protease Do